MKTYSKRTWLNNQFSPSTGAVVCFHGETQWRTSEEAEPSTFLEISDCHGKIRLHQTPNDSSGDFVKKMRMLAFEITQFADFLEYQKDEVEEDVS